MATKKSVLIERLALARRAKAQKGPSEAHKGPQKPLEAPEGDKPPLEREIPADGQRNLAKACAEDAMVMGWDKSVQKHAYENRISEDEMRKILDEALDYNDKADPSGRIHELDDWKKEKMGRSVLSQSSRM